MSTSESHELSFPDHFTAGAVGPKGQRVFFLQAAHLRGGGEGAALALRIEKQQVAALAEYLAAQLAEIDPPIVGVRSAAPLVEPVQPAWIVGSLGIAYEEDSDSFVVVAEELVPEGTEAASARIQVSRVVAAGFVETAREAVAVGRPPCRICGRPADLAGPVCLPCAN